MVSDEFLQFRISHPDFPMLSGSPLGSSTRVTLPSDAQLNFVGCPLDFIPKCGAFEERNYKVYLQENRTLTQEKSTCVSHNTINMADTKASNGLAATGVGTVVCMRHDMRLANGVGDLQRGENGTRSFGIESQHLFPYDFIPTAVNNIACQTTFLFNWSPHVGRMDREAPEWGWADINRVAASTKEMAPGTHQDILDDHFGDWNRKKVTALGRTLLRKIKDAINAERDHRHALADLEGSIKKSDLGATSLAAWMKAIVAWENDHTKPNPFNKVTQAAVRLALIQQDMKDLEEGISISLHSEVTPSILISTGLDLKDAHTNVTQHRILEFLAWQAKWWDEWTTLQVAKRSVDVEGLAAYAKHQAAICQSLAARFRALWGNVPTLIDLYALILVP
ncbi:hypothetical protein EDD22DRAFT_850854 [Suillus occidentalis]|nr:hypothetical protein EDD22DRAFT_850854 [Suillus occidentalis]